MKHQSNGQNKRHDIQKGRTLRGGESELEQKEKTNQIKEFKRTTYYHLLLKAERLASAIEILSDISEKSHPLISAIQKDAIHLLALVADLHNVSLGGREGAKEAHHALVRLVSYLSVARTSGVLNPKNCDILIEEYSALSSFVRIASGEQAEKVLDDILDTSYSYESRYRDQLWEGEGGVFLSPHRNNPLAQTEGKSEKNTHGADLGTSRTLKDSKTYTKDTKTEKDIQEEKQKDRRERILRVIQNKGQVSIKDISKEVTDCSEKTIQRELVELVSKGVLKKEGERRWSTYALR